MKRKSATSNNKGALDACRLGTQSAIKGVLRFSLLLALLALQGCATFLQGPQDDPRAREAISELTRRNMDLTQFKGLLGLRLEAAGQHALAGRAGWAAAAPDRLRLEWLNMLGQPILSLAADGETITIISHAERRYRQLAQSAGALQKLIKLPVTVEDLITLISGRPLMPDFLAAHYTSNEGEARKIALKDRWHNTMATLSFSGDQLYREILFTAQGEELYQIEWQQWQNVEQMAIPRQIVLSASSGERLTISIDRFWPRSDLAPSTFFLDRPQFAEE